MEEASRALREHETTCRADGKSVVGVFSLGLAYFAELQLQEVKERATASTPSRTTKTYSTSGPDQSIERGNIATLVKAFEESRDGSPQQLDAREHDGWKFSASRCRK